jgi:hypothetical protein
MFVVARRAACDGGRLSVDRDKTPRIVNSWIRVAKSGNSDFRSESFSELVGDGSQVIDLDCCAGSYDHALADGLAISGEGREYFAEGRIEWLADCLRRRGSAPCLVVDYGCGTGSTSPLLLDLQC